MDKMMHSRDQELKQLNATIDRWYQSHFHNVSSSSALGASLAIARDDLKRSLGITLPGPAALAKDLNGLERPTL